MKARGLLAVALIAGWGLLAACGDVAATAMRTATPALKATATAITTPTATGTAGPRSAPAAVQPGPFSPNELGQVPILEIHRIGAKEGRWMLTPAHMRRLLADLYAAGFRPVTFRDVVNRHIDIPRGYAPVVLTFDDGDPSQFQWAPGGKGTTPAADSAVGILWDFHKTHPDWAAAASFYVNADPFGRDSAGKVRWLVAHGFEVGDHTLNHVDMTRLNAAQMLHQVGGMAAWIQKTVPGYHVATLAYPFGFAHHLAPTAWKGQVGGQSYTIRAALLVGAGPAPSPYSKQWRPHAVPRIQVAAPSTLVHPDSVHYVWAGWEPRLLANEGADLYVSDGDPAKITIRSGERADLAKDVPAADVVIGR